MPAAFAHGRPRAVLAAVEPYEAGAEATVEVAGVLAAAFGAEVVLAALAPLAQAAPTADDVVPLRPTPPPELQTAIDGLTQSRAERAAARLPAAVPRRTVLCRGPAGPAIVDAARSEDADLVVVPMRRAGVLGHLLHDGTDRYVLHHSDVPVLVVPVDPPGAGAGAGRGDTSTGAAA
jgi:nucleotide-binding universal stress UspA family protein